MVAFDLIEGDEMLPDKDEIQSKIKTEIQSKIKTEI